MRQRSDRRPRVRDRSIVRRPDRRQRQTGLAGEAIAPAALEVVDPDVAEARRAFEHGDGGALAARREGEAQLIEEILIVDDFRFAAAIGEHEPAATRFGAIYDYAVRCIEFRAGRWIEVRDVVRDQRRLAEERALLDVDALREQFAVAHEGQLVVRYERRLRDVLRQDRRLVRIERGEDER